MSQYESHLEIPEHTFSNHGIVPTVPKPKKEKKKKETLPPFPRKWQFLAGSMGGTLT